MTGHDLDRAQVLADQCERAGGYCGKGLLAEVESLRARLAEVEQEREATATNALRTVNKISDECDRAEAALAAVRELPHEDWCCGDGCSNPYHRAGCSDCFCWKSDVEAAITATAEQDEPTVEIGGQVMTQTQFDAARAPLLPHSEPGDAAPGPDEPKREQS